MKQLIFPVFLIALFLGSCQRESLTPQEISPLESNIPLNLEKIEEILDQIDYSGIQARQGRLHFQSMETFFETVDLLRLADVAFQAYCFETPNVNYSENYIANNFKNHFEGFSSLLSNNEDLYPTENISKEYQTLLNQEGEVFINGTYNLFFPDGHSSYLENPSEAQIRQVKQEEQVSQREAGNDCHLHRSRNAVTVFDYCGTEFIMQVGLRLFNINGMHVIEATNKCHKLGQPDELFEVGELAVELGGNLSIACFDPIEVHIPSVHNTNLVGGQVPFSKNCHNCGSILNRITYSKDVSLREGNEVLKGHYRLKIEHCGNLLELEDMLDIINL